MPELNLLTAFVVKPAVMLLSGVGIVALARRGPAPWARILLAGLVLFLAGEVMCGVDVYNRQGMSLLNEGGHDLLMALSFGFFLVGAFRFLEREDRCWNPGCPEHPHCGRPPSRCPDSRTVPRLLGWILVGAAVLGWILPTADPGLMDRTLPAGWGDTVVGHYEFRRTAALSDLQQKWIPLAGADLLLLAGAFVILRRRLRGAVVWAAGLGGGLVAFGYLRVLWVHPFSNRPVLGLFWEEVTEALFLLLFLYGLRVSGEGAAVRRTP